MTSNFIPYLPSSPPPLTDDEDDDDEFGSFTIANHLCNDKVTESSKTPIVREKSTIDSANGDQSLPITSNSSPLNNQTEKLSNSIEIESESHNKYDVNGTNCEYGSDNIDEDIPVTVTIDSRPSTSRSDDPEERKTDVDENCISDSERTKQTLNSSDQSDEFGSFVIPSEPNDYSTSYQNDAEYNDDFESSPVFPKTDVDIPDLVFNPVFEHCDNSFDESPQKSNQAADDCNDDEWFDYTSMTQNATAGDDEDDEFSEFVSPPSDDALLTHKTESKSDSQSDFNLKNESSDSRRNSSEQFEANFEAHFDDFESADSTPSIFLSIRDVTKTLHNSFETNNLLHEEIIESLDIYNKPSVSEDTHSNCNIWLHISDNEKADALSFQWSNSNCNKKLLKAINIDSRNLLFGHNWNSSVPLFAANLSLNPLEPTKTSPKTNDVTGDKESITSSPQEFIPPAQFDWNSSGLINPLDASNGSSALLDLDFFFTNEIGSVNPVSTATWSLENELLGSDAADLDINCTENSAKVSPMLEQILSSAKLSASNFKQTKASTALSNEAQLVLNKLPDLRFMQAKVLMFPIRSATP